MMRIRIVEGLEGAGQATGAVVVIDVLRAFTTAAYAIAAGIEQIELVATVDEALSASGFRMGEVRGRRIPGFDHDNSPSRLIGRRLSGRAVLRTSSGTRCVVAAERATELWLGSLVVASATAAALAEADRDEVTLVASGRPHEGEEDLACAEWLAARLRGDRTSEQRAVAAVRASRAAVKHGRGDPDFPSEDVDCAASIDAFDFAMKADRQNGSIIARPIWNNT